jgi:hypothetical protein
MPTNKPKTANSLNLSTVHSLLLPIAVLLQESPETAGNSQQQQQQHTKVGADAKKLA